MESHPYFDVLAALDAAELPAPVYRTARRLLDQAAIASQPGYIEINHDAAKQMVGSEAWGTVRSHLIQLESNGIIKKWLNHSCRVYFVAYPPPTWLEDARDLPTNSRAERSLSRDLPTEPAPIDEPEGPDRALGDHFRANHQQNRALGDHFRALGDQKRAISPGSKELSRVEYLSFTPNDGSTQLNPPPQTEKLTARLEKLKPDQRWAYELLISPEIGMLPKNAIAAVKLHTASHVIRQVAAWWIEDRNEVSVGALFWRLMNPGSSHPGPANAKFLDSALYRRHYPLDESQTRHWMRWLENQEYADVIIGLSKPTISAEVEALIEQLPAPPPRVEVPA